MCVPALQPISQSYPQQSMATMGRNHAARNAVKTRSYQPPVRGAPAQVTVPSQPRMVQRNLVDLFGQQQQQQELARAEGQGLETGMEF